MPQAEQVWPIPPQFAGQLGRGHALGDAAQDQDQFGGPPVGLVEDRLGEGVEDAAAGDAAVVQDRGAESSVDLQALADLTPRAGQAVGVEHPNDQAIASVLVHQVDQGEVHGRLGLELIGTTSLRRYAAWATV